MSLILCFFLTPRFFVFIGLLGWRVANSINLVILFYTKNKNKNKTKWFTVYLKILILKTLLLSLKPLTQNFSEHNYKTSYLKTETVTHSKSIHTEHLKTDQNHNRSAMPFLPQACSLLGHWSCERSCDAPSWTWFYNTQQE